jgi:hypothetical protein
MTLQPIPSEFPYTVYEEKFYLFFYHCSGCKNDGMEASIPLAGHYQQ